MKDMNGIKIIAVDHGYGNITARFDLSDADEARAAEYLKSLKRG